MDREKKIGQGKKFWTGEKILDREKEQVKKKKTAVANRCQNLKVLHSLQSFVCSEASREAAAKLRHQNALRSFTKLWGKMAKLWALAFPDFSFRLPPPVEPLSPPRHVRLCETEPCHDHSGSVHSASKNVQNCI